VDNSVLPLILLLLNTTKVDVFHFVNEEVKKMVGKEQGCQNGRHTVKFTIQTSTRVRVYLADAFLSAHGFLPIMPTVKKCVNVDSLTRPRGRGADAQTRACPRRRSVDARKKIKK
jgi:hypothetical protein